MLPRPAEVRVHDGVFTLDPATALDAEPALTGVAGWLRGRLGPATGCWLPPGCTGRPDCRLFSPAARCMRTAAMKPISPGGS